MKKISIVTLLFLCVSFNESFAQFEGTIKFKSYEVESDEKMQEEDDSFTLYITADRMLLQGDHSYKVGGALETEGILVRHQEKDFVFLTGEKQAMKISKAGITSFMNMFGGEAKSEMKETESNMSIENTGENQTINGYNATKFIITNKENPDERSEVWMTQDLDIYWGMLSEPWGDNMKGFTGSDLPLDLIFEQGYFPIQWQQYENDELTQETVAEVDASDVAKSMVEIASGVKVVSLQEYMFEQMRRNQ